MIVQPNEAVQVVQEGRPVIGRGWIAWFSQVTDTCNALRQSGTTAQRPVKGLFVGRRYFDNSLGAKGKPIWVDKNGTGWVDGAGNSV